MNGFRNAPAWQDGTLSRMRQPYQWQQRQESVQLENANVRPEEVDLILVSTISSNVILPCAACEVQKEIGALNATCFDLSAACTGFVLAYNTAAAYIAAGMLPDSTGYWK